MAKKYRVPIEGHALVEADDEAQALSIAKAWAGIIVLGRWSRGDFPRGIGPVHFVPNPDLKLDPAPAGFISVTLHLNDKEEAKEITEQFDQLVLETDRQIIAEQEYNARQKGDQTETDKSG